MTGSTRSGDLFEIGVYPGSLGLIQAQLGQPALVVNRHGRAVLHGALDVVHADVVAECLAGIGVLEHAIRRYQSRAIEAAQVIEELIQLARDRREANARGEKLGLTDDELAFYDALETNDSAVKVLGDETLRGIARELVATVRSNVTID